MDSAVSSEAMQTCDASMAFLIGSSLSVGSLTNLAKAIETDGPEKMPGLCCLDKATDSEYLGHDVRVTMFLLTCFLFCHIPNKCSFGSQFYHF